MSTTDACFVVKEIINKYKASEGVLTFIDLTKAFDSVDHFVLRKKMLQKNLPVDNVYILLHYLRNQMACVKWKHHESQPLYVNQGVRQGGVLSPFLFKFYINDLLNEISQMNEGCIIGIHRINIIAYADDIVLCAASEQQMNNIYAKFSQYIDDLNLKINLEKN